MREMLGGFWAVTILAMVFGSVYYVTGCSVSELSPVSAIGDDSSTGSTDDESSSDSDAAVAFVDIQTTRVQPATTAPLQATPYVAERPFSASTECKTCHPRQYDEWRASPHSYSGISPTFYSLVAAGQNSFGAGALINSHAGVSQGGGVGNFCLPCHSPMAFMGLEGRFSGNNYGFSEVQPQIPYVCNVASGDAAFTECNVDNSEDVCGAAGRCIQFQARTCVNMPSVTEGILFPRVVKQCTDNSQCSGTGSGCPAGEDCGPCIVAPATIYYSAEAQEGINCETCHNALPNHRRACQQFRNSDSVGVNSMDWQERSLDGVRLRFGPYPVAQTINGQGIAADRISPRKNTFHESARVDTPLVIPYYLSDRALAFVDLFEDTTPEIVRPTSVTCEELPYCRTGVCEGGPNLGFACSGGLSADFDCGGCSLEGFCGPGGDRAGKRCQNSIDCATPADVLMNVMDRGIKEGTLGPLFARRVTAGGDEFVLDRPDGNYYRSSMFCGTCHDVRPLFVNPILRSCQLQDTHVCSTNDDCKNLGIQCGDPLSDDCGPCVAESGSAPMGPNLLTTTPSGAMPAVGNPRNTGVRRVENLFSEWQISPYNHPELTFCSNDAFQVCTVDGDCPGMGTCSVVSPTNGLIGDSTDPIAGQSDTIVATCQDCHMSLFPRVPLVADTDGDGIPDTRTPKNDLYPKNLAAAEGSQSDVSVGLPVRRVSTHGMAGVDLPLVKFSGQSTQESLRQELLDSAYKINFSEADAPGVFPTVLDPATPPLLGDPPVKFILKVGIENVGVGHRLPAGFSHERQNWVQVYVQSRNALAALGLSDQQAFAPNAPCNMQFTIATGADQAGTSFIDATGAAALGAAGCVYRSGFILDKGHSETGEATADGNFDDEDPEDFFVVVGTRVFGESTDARIEGNPGAAGRALSIQYICEEETAEEYLLGVRDGTGIEVRADEFATGDHKVHLCDPNDSPPLAGEGVPLTGVPGQLFTELGSGFTSPGWGNPACDSDASFVSGPGFDLGPCVPEIELSDANERGRCAGDLALPSCQSNADCNGNGPCLYTCSEFPELECCDKDAAGAEGVECRAFYAKIDRVGECFGGSNDGTVCTQDSGCTGGGTCDRIECALGFEDHVGGRRVCVNATNAGTDCTTNGVSICTGDGSETCEDLNDVSMCIRGLASGEPCTEALALTVCGGFCDGGANDADPCNQASECPGGTCGDAFECGGVGECVVENRGIVNFQNAFRSVSNGVCVSAADPRETTGEPKPMLLNGDPVGCLLNLSCTLEGLGGAICLVNGQCAEDAGDGSGKLAGDLCTNVTYREDCGFTSGGNSIACNVERNLELNGRPSESVFIQNHPANFNSLPPLEPRVFEYEFGITDDFDIGDTLVVSVRIMNRHFPMRFLRNLIGTQVIRPPLIIENQGDSSDPSQCNDPRTIDIDCFVKPVVLLGNAERGGYVPAVQLIRTATILLE